MMIFREPPYRGNQGSGPPSWRRDGPGGVAPYHARSSDTGYVVLHRAGRGSIPASRLTCKPMRRLKSGRRLFSNPVAELPIEEPLELGNRNRTRAIGQVRPSIGNWLTTSSRTGRLGRSAVISPASWRRLALR